MVDTQRTVTVMLRAKVDGKWKRMPAAYGRNGRIKPGYAQVGDDQVFFADPAYDLRMYEGRQATYKAAGKNATEADAERRRLEMTASRADVQAAAAASGLKVVDAPERKRLTTLFTDYIEDADHRGAMEAKEQAELLKGQFLKFTAKIFVDEIDPREVTKFHAHLRKAGNSDRTVSNKHGRLRAVLRFGGVNTEDRNVFPPDPGYETKLPTIYTREQIGALLKAAKGRLRIGILLCLKLGLRDGEATHAEFSDVEWTAGVLRVRSKPGWGHYVKDSEERDVPIPADVLAELKAWRESLPEAKRNGLILFTTSDKPVTKMLLQLKRLAHTCGLDCGHCAGCKNRTVEGWGCHQVTLHKLRRSYLTTLLRNNVDLRTVQHFAGHSDLESTMRYLRPAEAEEVRERIDSIKW